MYWSCTKYILVRTAQKCMFWSTYLSLKVCTWYILAVLNTVCTGMYSVHTLFIDLVLLFFRFCGVHTGTYWGLLCTYFAVSAMFCRPALPCRFACKRFMHWNTYSTKAHYHEGLLTAWQDPCQCLPVHYIIGTTGHLRWLAGGCSCGGSALNDSPSSNSEMMISSLLAAPARASDALRVASGRLKDLGFKLWRWW